MLSLTDRRNIEPRFASGSLKRRAPEPVRKPAVKKPEAKPVPVQRKPSPEPSPPAKQSQPAPAEPPPGHCELNPFMTRALNTELQDVMIKVWQALPDDPKTDAEKYAAEKLKTDTGDDIRNVLGLNVAKRLLNIFNPLNVKIHFSTIPQRAYLRSFLKKYSFVSFKRVERTTKTFSATVKTIQDFDRLCDGHDLRCGSSKVTVSPTYKFTHCPSKLKPIEKIQSSKEKPKIQDAGDKETVSSNPTTNDKEETKDESQNKETKPADVVTKETHVIVSVNSKTPVKLTQVQSPQVKQGPKPQLKDMNSKQQAEIQVKNTPVNQSKVQNATAKPTANTKPQDQNSQVKVVAKTSPQGQDSQVKQTTVATKQAQNSPAKPAANTKEPDQNSQGKPTTVNKQQEQKPQVKPAVTPQQGSNSQVKPAVNTKTQDQTPQVKATAENKSQCQNAKTVTQNKPQGQSPQIKSQNTKSQPNSATKAAAKPQVQIPQAKSSATKQQAQVKPVIKPQVQNSQVKPVQKPKEKNPPTKNPDVKSKPVPKSEKKTYKDKDDFEELDDHDILALMSEGIVLDECSGSDEE